MCARNEVQCETEPIWRQCSRCMAAGHISATCPASLALYVVRQPRRQLADQPGTQREIAALQQVDVLCFAAVVRSNEARICRPCVPGPASAIVGAERKKQPEEGTGIAYALRMLSSVISHQSSVIFHNL